MTRLLTLLGPEHRAGHRPGQLSGGEQRRLAVACAAAFAALGGEGVAFVLSSHDPRVLAAPPAGRVLVTTSGMMVD